MDAHDPGLMENWQAAEYDDADWETVSALIDDGDDGRQLNLTGPWRRRIGRVMPRLEPAFRFFGIPTAVYGTLLAPALDYTFDGAIWYQGESNAFHPDDPDGQNWAALRAQQKRCLTLPNVAMADVYNCGEWNDLHPLDKRTVGRRLGLGARRLAYGEDISGAQTSDTAFVYFGDTVD